MTQKNILTKQKQTLRRRNRLGVAKGRKGKEVLNILSLGSQMQTIKCRMDKQDLLYSTGTIFNVLR